MNSKIRAHIPREESRHIPRKEAQSMGAIALFGEKYGEFVRVITFDKTFSVELCGGTHVQHSGEIGLFHLSASSGIGAGIHRIEAFTGTGAQKAISAQQKQLHTIGHLVQHPTPPVEGTKALVTAYKNSKSNCKQ